MKNQIIKIKLQSFVFGNLVKCWSVEKPILPKLNLKCMLTMRLYCCIFETLGGIMIAEWAEVWWTYFPLGGSFLPSITLFIPAYEMAPVAHKASGVLLLSYNITMYFSCHNYNYSRGIITTLLFSQTVIALSLYLCLYFHKNRKYRRELQVT